MSPSLALGGNNATHLLELKMYARDNLETEKGVAFCHTRESGYPGEFDREQTWIPAGAGMTSLGDNRAKEIPFIFILCGRA